MKIKYEQNAIGFFQVFFDDAAGMEFPSEEEAWAYLEGFTHGFSVVQEEVDKIHYLKVENENE